MKISDSSTPCIAGARRRAILGWVIEGVGLAGLTAAVILSAVVTKEMQSRGNLAALVAMNAPEAAAVTHATAPAPLALAADPLLPMLATDDPTPAAPEADDSFAELPGGAVAEIPSEYTPAPVPDGLENDPNIRWFNGRPVRPARTIWMTVTAYSPDERSCAPFADGITASLHSVSANGMNLVAADSRVLPLGSMITVPGYAGDKIVPVLDRGGKIKGNRLDVLYPTHEVARKWGVQRLKVTVWEYADGQGPENWRRIRDSKQ